MRITFIATVLASVALLVSAVPLPEHELEPGLNEAAVQPDIQSEAFSNGVSHEVPHESSHGGPHGGTHEGSHGGTHEGHKKSHFLGTVGKAISQYFWPGEHKQHTGTQSSLR
ncbi:hypothetical protein FRC19_008618 [Serendipita sp. 401]|nr:hypothetical protein FRC19_008618 [Serendipita sp. 401]